MDKERFQAFLDAVEPDRGGTVLECAPIPGGYSRDTAKAYVFNDAATTETSRLTGSRVVTSNGN